jgi:4-diphosphocytidyl-2-C-methyl-D-erythritol kinase
MLERPAHAKINLRLCVLAQETSGYHQIETVLCLISMADMVTVEPAPSLSLDVEGGDAGPVDDNLVLRTARAFFARTGIPGGAAFRLGKRIPAGAGLGGGSSDAATALHLLNQMHGTPLDAGALLEIGFTLGSDVPFFVSGAACALAWGRGERLLTLPAPPVRSVIIVVPTERMATATAYAELARRREGVPHVQSPALRVPEDFATWDALERTMCNDFEPIADAAIPELPEVRRTLLAAGATAAQLSGSGSAVFALFDDEHVTGSAAGAVRDAHPDAHVFTARTLGTRAP